jgi:hypothetical protein
MHRRSDESGVRSRIVVDSEELGRLAHGLADAASVLMLNVEAIIRAAGYDDRIVIDDARRALERVVRLTREVQKVRIDSEDAARKSAA